MLLAGEPQEGIASPLPPIFNKKKEIYHCIQLKKNFMLPTKRI